MSDEQLPDVAPGKYVPYGIRPYYLPDDLPPDPEVNIGSEFQEVLQDAIYQLGQLQGISTETNVR